MENYKQNFLDLYAENEELVRMAIKEKKDLILNKFVTLISFSYREVDNKKIYDELYALMDSAFIFSYDEKEQFVYKKFLSIDKIKPLSHLFYVELDFRKMDHNMYCDLLANFYPCLSIEDINSIEDSFLHDLATLMLGDNGEYVLILDESKSFKGRVYLPYICKLIGYKDYLNKDEIDMIMDIRDHLNINIEWR